mgnify:CR=1 FL=1
MMKIVMLLRQKQHDNKQNSYTNTSKAYLLK